MARFRAGTGGCHEVGLPAERFPFLSLSLSPLTQVPIVPVYQDFGARRRARQALGEAYAAVTWLRSLHVRCLGCRV